MDPTLLPLFNPRGIVLIGASSSPEKLGYGVARNILQSGYQGPIHFVSQKPGQVFGRPLYTDVNQVPDPADLAILVVPPAATPQAIEACGRRGIRAAIILSSGFREAGEEGAALEEDCLQAAHRHGMRLLGPNCIGTIDTHLPLDTSFLQPPMPARGHIGFISQSGAFCAAVIDWARGEGFGFSRIVSLGNQVDVNETEMLSLMAQDENTQVIVLYMESVSDGRRFVEGAREVTRRKPVIALKAGRFESGQRAAASHTGALAASDIAFEAAFEKAGILRADTAEQLFDWARVLEVYPFPTLPFLTGTLRSRLRGEEHHSAQGGIAILTNAGGPGVIAADALEKNGLSLAKLHDPTVKALVANLPPAANAFNPVDMLASASPDTYAACLRILLKDDNVDSVLIILPPPPMFKAEDVAEELITMIAAGYGSSSVRKTIVVSLMGSSLVEIARSIFLDAKIPVFPFPERAASALGALAKRAEYLDDGRSTPDPILPRPSSMVDISLEDLFAAYKIPIAPLRLAQNLREAKLMADELGYPVVLKIASPDILHKSDVSGVMLDIQDVSALQIAYTQVMAEVRKARPDAQVEGVHIQRQIDNGHEVIAGAVRDAQFGPLMMFGSGGVEVEGLRDVSFALGPLTPAEALKMIRKTWAGKKLAGFRHLPPADEESVVDILIRLSYLIAENEFIQEIEINPLNVLEKGAVAVDVRMKQKR